MNGTAVAIGPVGGVRGKLSLVGDYIAQHRQALEGKRMFVQGLQGKLGICREETAVIGDGANDIAMMEEAGLKIAFAAKKAVRERADCSFEGGDWEGLAARLRQFKAESAGMEVEK